MKSLFTVLKEEGLTTLKIQNNWKTNVTRLYAAKEWDQDVDFSKYNKEFYAESLLTDSGVYYNTNQVWELYRKYGLEQYLQEVIDKIKAGRHFQIEAYYNSKYEIHFMYNQHSKKLGVHNKRRGLFTGGIRRHELDENELDCIQDGLNLGRAMSFKNIPAGVHYGGAKTVVQMPPLDLTDMEELGWLAYVIDKARGMSTPDMKLPNDMVGIIVDHFSKQWLAGNNSTLGSSAVPTGIGVFHAMKQAVKFKLGKETMDGITVAIQGLGDVGITIAKELIKENAQLMIADVNQETLDAFKEKYPDNVTIVPTDEIMNVEADVFCPCAMGGILTAENIPILKFKIIIGAANNQLKAKSVEEEIELAKLLGEQDILFQVDWWHNCGGVIVAIDEYELGDQTTLEKVIDKTIDRVSKLTWQKLNEAKEKGITPTEAIYKECEEIIYGDKELL